MLTFVFWKLPSNRLLIDSTWVRLFYLFCSINPRRPQVHTDFASTLKSTLLTVKALFLLPAIFQLSPTRSEFLLGCESVIMTSCYGSRRLSLRPIGVCLARLMSAHDGSLQLTVNTTHDSCGDQQVLNTDNKCPACSSHTAHWLVWDLFICLSGRYVTKTITQMPVQYDSPWTSLRKVRAWLDVCWMYVGGLLQLQHL